MPEYIVCVGIGIVIGTVVTMVIVCLVNDYDDKHKSS